MKKSFIAALLFISGIMARAFEVPSAVRGSQELLESGHWVYDSLAKISLEQGRIDFSDSSPLSISEIRSLLMEADYDSLSDTGKKEFDRVLSYTREKNIAFNASVFSLTFEPEVNIEGYYKANDDLDYVYDRYERRDFVKVPFAVQGGDWFTMKMDLAFRQNKGVMAHDDNYVNIPLKAGAVDVNFPDNGYFSTGYLFTDDAGVNFRLGTGTQSVGRSLTGSVIMSEYLTGTSWANLELYSRDFRYNMNVTQFNVDKYMYTHRLEARFFKKISFMAQESVLVYAPMELRFLNPLTIYHGMSPWRDYQPAEDDSETNVCAYLALKLNVVPVKYLRLYGMFAMTQYQTPYELEKWPTDCTPNGLGFQGGAEAYIPCRNGYFHAWLEGYWADPYMYVKEDPNWSMVRTYAENIGDMAVFYEWVGSPFGPDTIAGELNAGYEVPDRWSVTGTYLFMARGEYSGTNIFTEALDWGGVDTVCDPKEWVYPDSYNKKYGEEEARAIAKKQQSLTCPSGTPEYVNRMSLRGTLCASSAVKFTVQGAFTFIFNHDNNEGDFEYGPEFAFVTSIKLKEFLFK
ncbi:MAG: hypothetical protein J6O39_07640 [Treponema sp.]|nr:hypothetical protein [Treponema sp.]